MKTALIQIPGLNRDRDMIAALTLISGKAPQVIWQTQTELDGFDLIVIPGGFSYGDYLRCGAIGARMPVIQAIKKQAARGVSVLGVCNGFQILLEAGLLPGALLRNIGLRFVCREVRLCIANTANRFTRLYQENQVITCPVAHHDGNYFVDDETLKNMQDQGQVVLRYAENSNPNGSLDDIAGIVNEKGNVLGMMPHPENRIEAAHGGEEGRYFFSSVLGLTQ